MRLAEMLEVARAASVKDAKVGATTRKLAQSVVEVFDAPARELGPAAPQVRDSVVLVPREANKMYRPEEARALAAALLRAADEADGFVHDSEPGRPERVERTG